MRFDWGFQVLSIILALGTPLALWYRFWWGSKSQVSFRQLSDPRDRNWSYGSTEESWSNYVHVIAINRGWWTGVIWGVELQKVSFDDGHTVTDVSSETVKTEIDTYVEGESKRLDAEDPHQREERNIPGRDIAHVKLVPFLKTGGEIAKHAEQSDKADLTFIIRIEDNKRTDLVEFPVTMDVSEVEFDEV